MAKTVSQALKEIPDPRKRQGRQYPLYGLLAVLVLAAMQGERSLRRIWQWASDREALLLMYPSLGFRAVKRIPGFGYLLVYVEQVIGRRAGARLAGFARCRRGVGFRWEASAG
jgi:hypothetical protein